MVSWNLIQISDASFILMNSTETTISVSKRSKIDLTKLMVMMEDHNVPASYTKGIEHIRITSISVAGHYLNNKISLSSSCSKTIHTVLVHELAHHIDDIEDASSDPRLMKEKKKKARCIDDSYARHSVSEYFAVGFEIYYFGTQKQRSKLRKSNPILYKIIKSLHSKYSKM